MQIVIVDFRDMRIRYDDEGKIAEALYPMGQAGREEGQGEICRREQGLLRKWRLAMSRIVRTASAVN